MKRKASFLVLALLATLTATPARAADAPSRFEHFITRQGNKLMNGPRPFRFVGANMPGMILPYDFTLRLPERMALPTAWEQEDAFKTLDQMNFRVVRLWNLAIRDPKEVAPAGEMTWHHVQAPGVFNDQSFKVVDTALSLANKYGVRVVFDFTAEAGDYLGGIGTYAAHRGKKRKEFWTDPQIKEDYKATIRYVLNRTNTLTGVVYKHDKAILAWQFGNEMYSAPPEWLAEMAAYLKSLDPNHLVAETRHRPRVGFVIDPNIDLYTRHYYSNYIKNGPNWVDLFREEVAQLKGQRPLFIGEFGPYIDGKVFTHDNVVGEVRKFLDFVQSEEGISGALIWSMYFHHRNGGYYWHQIFTYPSVWAYHWPGFPSAEAQREQGILATLREAAFQIQGLPVPPVPVPDAPELLPLGDVPMISWRGSAGATGYDIQRAPAAAGPWTTIAAHVSDADVAYRPLFSDHTAHAGQTCCYRVVARNTSGASAPSNVVGPVQVKQVCLADELQDFSRVSGKSEGLQLSNDYNALYAEYLFRAKGADGDWLRYKVAGEIRSLKATAWFAGEVNDLTFHASADGKSWTVLPPKRSARHLPGPPGGPAGKQRRTQVDYQCDVLPSCLELKVIWHGPAELDRVEIYHPGQ
jgi:hypothetical protein